ncbi:hypothetical protein MNBD_CHLOROFLEXI01-2752, partial [hydrothermal vent metagenome]
MQRYNAFISHAEVLRSIPIA